MIARRAAVSLALSCLLAGLCRPAFAGSAKQFLERIETEPDSVERTHARNQVIVRYRHEGPAAVGECVESLLHEERSFAQATAGPPSRSIDCTRSSTSSPLPRSFGALGPSKTIRSRP